MLCKFTSKEGQKQGGHKLHPLHGVAITTCAHTYAQAHHRGRCQQPYTADSFWVLWLCTRALVMAWDPKHPPQAWKDTVKPYT